MVRSWRYTYVSTALIIILATLGVAYFVQRRQPRDIHEALAYSNIVPVLVIGSGPAGLSAALYTSRTHLPTIVLTGEKRGGQLADVRQIENWPGKEKKSGGAAVEDLIKQAEHFGAVLVPDIVSSIDLSVWPFKVLTRSNVELRPLAIIIATGRIAKRLAVPGVEKYWGRGVGTCTLCDAPFHKGQIVGVVGGGDSAGDHALQLAEYADKVYLFVRAGVMDASETVQDYVKNNKKIEIVYNAQIERVDGTDAAVQEVTVQDRTSGNISQIPVRGLYFAIGYHPNSELFKQFLPVDTEGFIIMPDRTQRTQIQGVFAAGDVIDKHYGKAGVATGSGVKAGIDAIDFLQTIGYNMNKEAIKQRLYIYKPVPGQSIAMITKMQDLKGVIERKPLVVVDFYGSSCPTCKAMMPQVEHVAQTLGDKVHFIKIETGVGAAIAHEYGITSVPQFIVFYKGKPLNTAGSLKTIAQLQEFLSLHLKSE